MSLPRVPGCGGPPTPRLRPSDSVERPGSLYARPILDGAKVPADRKGGAPEAICKGLPATTSTPAIRPAPHTARPHPSPSRTLHPSPVLGPASGPDTATGSSWGFPGVLRFCGAWKCAQHWDCGPWERHLLLGYQGPPSECVPSSPTPTGTPVAVGGGSHPPACSPSFQPHPAHSGLCKHPPRPRPCPWTLGVGGGAGEGQGGETSYSSAQSQPLPVLPDSPDKLSRMECDLRMSVPSLDDKSPGRQMPGPCRTVTWAPCVYPLVPQSPHPTPGSRAGRPCAWGDRADRAS